MVYYSQSLDATFAALADPTRRAILARLAAGDSSVTELAAPFRVSLPAVAKHLRILERTGLITTEKTGRVRRCRLDAAPLHQAASWLEHYRGFWEARLDALKSHLLAQERRWKSSPRRSANAGARSRSKRHARHPQNHPTAA